jgi:hypothetical protein
MNKFYQGTPEQALAYAEDICRRSNKVKVASEKYETVDDAITNLVSEVDYLINTLRYQEDRYNRKDLLNAIYQFAQLEQALEIVRIKVDQAYDNYHDDDHDDDYDDDEEAAA